jgi:amino acid transporter
MGQPPLQRHLGLLHATALNVTQIVGAGVFLAVPLMIQKLPGPYALLGWLSAGVLILLDGLVWAELGAALPGSGGSCLYLRECFGRDRAGRPMAFLFVWQFLISGPLEIASGLIAIAQFATAALPADWRAWNDEHAWKGLHDLVAVAPSTGLALASGVVIIALLYRRIDHTGRLVVLIWLGVLAALAWVLVEGAVRFDPHIAFDPAPFPTDFAAGLGGAMLLAIYSYLGYYNVCYLGDEVRDPGRTIPRAVLLSAALVVVLFVGVHLALVGSVPWRDILADKPLQDNLPAEFLRRVHGDGAATAMSLLLVFCCFGSAFAGILGYSRIPYAAAREGYFFTAFGRVHPTLRIPHVGLLLVGALTLFWSLFALQDVIEALIATRILEQFIAQSAGLVLLRRRRPDLPRPFRVWLAPLTCGLAAAGWLFVYASAGSFAILLGLGTLLAGVAAYLAWSYHRRAWPFAAPIEPGG